MNYSDDSVYIKRIKEGDINAFTYIVAKHQNMLYNLIYKMLYNKEDTEDLLQEIFIKIFNSIDKFNGKSKFSTWLYSIAYHTALSKLRKKTPFTINYEDNIPEIEENGLSNDLEESDKLEKITYLREAMRTLSYDDRFLISLFYMEDHSIEEIGSIVNQSPSNVKVRLHRIRKRLATEMNKLMK